MTENLEPKARLVYAALFLGVILGAAIYGHWVVVILLTFIVGTWNFIYFPSREPYSLARWLFSFALLCSWQLLMAAKDASLRRGAWLTGVIALIGNLVGYEMKLRATRNSGGVQ